jgi:Holliday junction resolvase RusA-like endonuclease
VSAQPSLLPAINHTLVLTGHVPSKKNLWQRGKNGRMFLDAAVKAQIDALTRQASAQWPDPPIKHPDIDIQFYTRDARPDRDNKLTTILDCLRDAGVIKNDNIGSFNGTLTIRPAIIQRNERVIVKVSKA